MQIQVRVVPLDLGPYLQNISQRVLNQVAQRAVTGEAEEAKEMEDVAMFPGGQADQASRESLEHCEHPADRDSTSRDEQQAVTSRLLRLAQDHLQHIRTLALQRGLLERRFYLIVPATELDERSVSRTGQHLSLIALWLQVGRDWFGAFFALFGMLVPFGHLGPSERRKPTSALRAARDRWYQR